MAHERQSDLTTQSADIIPAWMRNRRTHTDALLLAAVFSALSLRGEQVLSHSPLFFFSFPFFTVYLFLWLCWFFKRIWKAVENYSIDEKHCMGRSWSGFFFFTHKGGKIFCIQILLDNTRFCLRLLFYMWLHCSLLCCSCVKMCENIRSLWCRSLFFFFSDGLRYFWSRTCSSSESITTQRECRQAN